MKRTGIIAFTEHGCVLGEKLLRDLQKQDQEIYGFVKSKYVDLPERHSFQKVTGTLREWAEEWIPKLDGIIFFSATGIAVRTIAPFVVSKKTDPAVVVIDEQGNYAISLLSGHLGGANELAKFAAESIGAVPVITTGTDVNHTFAVDVFARKNNLVIADMRLAKEMAALLIRGKTITWGAGEGFVYPKGQNIPLQLQFQETESPDGKKGTLWFAIPQSDGADSSSVSEKCVSRRRLQETYAGRKNRNADPNLSVRSRNIHNTNPAGSQYRSEKRGAGTAGVLWKVSNPFCDLQQRRAGKSKGNLYPVCICQQDHRCGQCMRTKCQPFQ